MTLERARFRLFSNLHRCPACGSDVTDYRSIAGDFQSLGFLCGASFSRSVGSPPAVDNPCPAPTAIAVRHLEEQAAAHAAKEAA